MSSATSQFDLADHAAQFILSQSSLRPRIGLVLGSGLGGIADDLQESVKIPYAEIGGFPQSTAIGHAGNFIVGTADGVVVAAMQGRVHLYEGYTAQQVAFPIRVFSRMGIKSVVLTNAAGGINRNYAQGALVAIRDHINLQGQNPLLGPNDERFGPRFPDMTDCYNAHFRQFVLDQRSSLGDIHEGVYAALLGPSFETPAEIQFLQTIGADLVGFSTVPEVIAARHMGMNVLGISCVTNMAAGLSGKKISHEEVLDTGERVRAKFASLLRSVLSRMQQHLLVRST